MRFLPNRRPVRLALIGALAAVPILVSTISTPATAAPATGYFDSVPEGTTLYGNDYMYVYTAYGDGNETKLVMQTDGNLVQYYYTPGNAEVCWSSGTYGNPGAYAVWQDNSYLLVLNEVGRPIWASPDGAPGTTLSMNTDDGALFAGDAKLSSFCSPD
jgi:pseudomonalisin